MPPTARKAATRKSAAKGATAKNATTTAGAPAEGEPEDTGNYPLPDDGPQDDIDQAALPAFDDVLIDGADLEVEE